MKALQLLALVSIAFGACAPAPEDSRRDAVDTAEEELRATPGASVIVLLVDTLRADILGPYGGDGRTSEHFAALAREGVLYEDCVSAAPWTLPSVASLFTGTLPRTHGAGLEGEQRFLGGPGQSEPLAVAKELPTLAKLLREQGYATLLRGTNPFVRFGLEADFERAELRYAPAGAVVDWGLQALAELPREKPYLLVLHFLDLHEPNQIGVDFGREDFELYFPSVLPPVDESERRWPAPDLEPYRWQHLLQQRKRLYLASQRYVDREIGRFLKSLAELHPQEARFVVYTSDHGEDFFENFEVDLASGHTDPRAGYRAPISYGHGHSLHRALTHVPLAISGPGLPRGRRVADTVGSIDVLPTLCRLLDLPVPSTVQGRCLPFVGRATPRSYLSESIAYGRERVALTTPDGWKLVHPLSAEERPQLFFLPDDPREKLDLAAREPARLTALREALERALAAVPRGAGTSIASDSATQDALRALGYVGAQGAQGETKR
ncbi:MAG: sulfatase [Planctomycetes bacterium]|nr:sulfatase [Planctomycetota bacterium]